MGSHVFLTFDDAVSMTNQLISFLNDGLIDTELEALAKKFKIRLKENRTFHVDEINRNCPECSGCHAGGCILGCFKHSSSSSVLCYWDKALDSIIGSKLVVHEMFHLIFEQGYDNDLPEDEAFELSEKFAMFGEENFDFHLRFDPDEINSNPIIESLTIPEISGKISDGFFLALGFTAFVLATFYIFGGTIYQIKKRKNHTTF